MIRITLKGLPFWPLDPAYRTGDRDRSSDAGLTLVEMLVALIIISVVFAAVASSLINFSRSSINSERRVQATSFANELHERLQGLPWDAAYHESSDVDLLAGSGGVDGYAGGPPPRFEGEDIIVDEESATGYAPVPVEVVDVPDIYDDAFQIVTWTTRPGVPTQTIKRFTTVVRWSILGRDVEARLTSERTATAQELGAASPASVELTFEPSPLAIEDQNPDDPADPDWRSTTALTIDAIFPNEWDLATVEQVVAWIPTEDGELSVDLEKLGSNPIDPISERMFRGTLAPDAGPFTGPSALPVRLEWMRSSTPEETVGQIFLTTPSGSGDVDPPKIESVTLVTPVVQVGIFEGTPNRLCSSVQLSAEVSNADDDFFTIQATFNPDSGPVTLTMVAETINLDGPTTYTLGDKLKAGSAAWDAPPGNSTNSDTFRVSVAETAAPSVPSQQLSIQQPPGSGNNRPCPS